MITGENKSKVDKIWNALWTAGLTVATTVTDQMTYLFFMKMIDDEQIKKEKIAAQLGIPVKEPMFNPTCSYRPSNYLIFKDIFF